VARSKSPPERQPATQESGSADILRRAGLRVTAPRLAVADFLFDGMHKHVTAEHLHAALAKRGQAIALATIYNTLNQFVGAGLLREISMDSARTYFDTNVDDHHHFFDTDAGRLTDIPAESVHIGRLPSLPAGAKLDRVDVIIRVCTR